MCEVQRNKRVQIGCPATFSNAMTRTLLVVAEISELVDRAVPAMDGLIRRVRSSILAGCPSPTPPRLLVPPGMRGCRLLLALPGLRYYCGVWQVSRHELETVRAVKNHVEALLNRVQRIRKACQAQHAHCSTACCMHAGLCIRVTSMAPNGSVHALGAGGAAGG